MTNHSLEAIDGLQIEPLSDELLESVAGATSTGPSCCSCSACTYTGPQKPPVGSAETTVE